MKLNIIKLYEHYVFNDYIYDSIIFNKSYIINSINIFKR